MCIVAYGVLPLARAELGTWKVQGLDYAYSLACEDTNKGKKYFFCSKFDILEKYNRKSEDLQ